MMIDFWEYSESSDVEAHFNLCKKWLVRTLIIIAGTFQLYLQQFAQSKLKFNQIHLIILILYFNLLILS
jgi:uncharacterized membrane protein YesL